MIALDQFFKAYSKSTDTFNLLPKPNYNIINIEEEIESNFDDLKKGNELRAKLNNEQENIVKNIIESVEDNTQKNKAFFIDGPGGTGKTFVYNTITHLMKGKNKKVKSVANNPLKLIKQKYQTKNRASLRVFCTSLLLNSLLCSIFSIFCSRMQISLSDSYILNNIDFNIVSNRLITHQTDLRLNFD